MKLTVQLPECLNKDTVPIEVSGQETLTQLRESLSLIPRTENLTCYSIFYGDNNLDQFDEITTFEEIWSDLNIDSEEATFNIVPKAYTFDAVKEHILKFRQVVGLHLMDKSNLATTGGTYFQSLNLEKPKEDKDEVDSKAISESVASILSGESSATATNPIDSLKVPIRNLTVSQWSPVPPHRSSQGDLLYITLTTLENETLNITCHYSGFFINKSSGTTFLPVAKFNTKPHFLLYDLVAKSLKKFEQTMIGNSEILHLNSDYPETYLLPTTTIPNFPYLVEETPVVNTSKIFNQPETRDWNDEFQSIKELPVDNVNARILREKLLQKIIHEFTKEATSTAIEIVGGNHVSMNISTNPEELTYLKNGIFFSHSIDATSVFAQTGGDEAARYTSSKDLQAIKILNRVDANGDIHNLLSCIVDYMGKRIVCQAPVPGIFNSDEDKVAIGATEDGLKYSEEFDGKLKNLAETFHLKEHEIEGHNFSTSKDIKGLSGTDGRQYIIDLFRTAPIDVKFLEKNPQYPHQQALIRFEAVEEWWRRRLAVLLKEKTTELEAEKQKNGEEKEEKEQILVEGTSVSVDVDSAEGEAVEISEFLDILIGEFLDETAVSMAPFDGEHLTSMLHRSGINMRYLGRVAQECATRISNIKEETKESIGDISNEELLKIKEDELTTEGKFEPVKANLSAIHKTAVIEMISRAVKHSLRKLTSGKNINLTKYIVTHFLNRLFNDHEIKVDETLTSFLAPNELEFLKLTNVEALVKEEVKNRFGYAVEIEISRQLFREISLKFGIQWKKDVSIEAIEVSDLVGFFPLIKDSSYKPSLIDEILETAKVELSKDQETGILLFNELLGFHDQIFGRIHKETASYYSFLSQLYSDLKVPNTFALQSCILNERVWGLDNYQTVTAYINAGYFESAENPVNSLKLYSHAISIWKTAYGDSHPSFITTYANLGDTLSKLKIFDSCKKLFEASIELSKQINGDVSDVTALVTYRYATCLLYAENYKAAADHFRKSFEIFDKIFGKDDQFTVKSLKFVRNIDAYLKSKKTQKPPAPVKKSKSKKKQVVSDPEIASKSVDDIMAFIEGNVNRKPRK